MKGFSKLCLVFIICCLSVLSFTKLSYAKQADNFELKDAQGNTVSLSDYHGKPLILHFWATWCPYCKKLQPSLDRLYLKYKDQGLVLLAISFREDPGTLPQQVLDQRGHHFKTLIDGDAVAAKWGVTGTPTTFFINREGRILGVTRLSDGEVPEFEKAVVKLLQE